MKRWNFGTQLNVAQIESFVAQLRTSGLFEKVELKGSFRVGKDEVPEGHNIFLNIKEPDTSGLNLNLKLKGDATGWEERGFSGEPTLIEAALESAGFTPSE